ncbi:MAG: DUF5682 family protein [Myxococcota bacterium]
MANDAIDTLMGPLRAAAQAFSADADALDGVLSTLAQDVARARSERLPIFPVIHHSPASAVHMVRYLREKKPKVVFLEMCEDFHDLIEPLRDCTLPVAFQAFAGEVEGHPPEWTPLSVVAPITELSAEYQAMAYAMQHDDVDVVFVDRSVDHVFLWEGERDANLDAEDDDAEPEEEEARMHGGALGIQVGNIVPTFPAFRDFLLQNARMSRFEEWTALYVEEPTIGADTETYREVLFLVGSLFRRLGSRPHEREVIRRRDRYMWTRIKAHLARTGVDPTEAVFVCGAAHAVDDECPEWGLDNDLRYEIPKRTQTQWLHGFIPSSYAAIEHQFGYSRGAVTLAEARWKKAVKTWNLQPFTLPSRKSKAKGPKRIKKAKPPVPLSLSEVLSVAPALGEADADELLGWCTGIVAEARRARYLASTADAIAIYETSMLLANLRSRRRPTPYDFIDAAETCLEKGAPPGRRNVRQLCSRLLGGDRVGQVGYDSLPPLVQNIYDRLEPLGIHASTRRKSRVLLDFTSEPEKRPCSRLLWRLRWLLPQSRVAVPIMGDLKLGMQPKQESWDVALHGHGQREVIQLAFEGVTVEQVLERRLSERAFGADATTVDALEAAEVSEILLESPRLTQTLGERAVERLLVEVGADDAPEIFARIRRLDQHYRTQPTGAPGWVGHFIATGYQHYTSQLPEAFADRGTTPEQLAAMLSFVFTLESLALAQGGQRSQLRLAIEHAGPGTVDPEKLGLLWAAEWLVQRRDEAQVRAAFGAILEHPLGRSAYPRYLSGFLQSLAFAPKMGPLGVELLGRAFAELGDDVLLPWMPTLLQELRPRSADVLPSLFGEALRALPRSLDAVTDWQAPWLAPPVAVTSSADAAPSAEAALVGQLLRAHPAAADAVATLFGREPGFGAAPAAASPTSSPGLPRIQALLEAHPDARKAVERLFA